MIFTGIRKSFKGSRFLAFLLLFSVVKSETSNSEVIVSPERNAAAIVGSIDSATAEEFVAAMKRHPSTNVLYLDSTGGAVFPSLVIAHAVNDMGISTVVPLDATCASACSTIYFAGVNRRALGKLGVHRIYSTSRAAEMVDLLKAAYALTMDAFIKFNVDTYVLIKMIQTAPDSIYFFSDVEKEIYKIDASFSDLKPLPESASRNLFSQYAVRVSDSETYSLPDFSGRDLHARQFRTRISNGIKDGANFASHFSIVEIGCGTDCSFTYVVNRFTGKVYEFPLGGEGRQEMALIYSIDSKLIKARWTDFGDGACVQVDYVWDEPDFRPIFETTWKSLEGGC